MKRIALLASLAAACMTPVTTNSTTFLSPADSRAIVGENVQATSLDVVRMFDERHFNLVDQHPADGGLVLTFRGSRGAVTEGDRHGVTTYDVGSEFVATLRPMPGGVTQVELFGRPLLNGGQPYDTIAGDPAGGRATGADEAEVVHGVLSELQLAGKVVQPSPAAQQQEQSALDQCKTARVAVFERAKSVSDPDARAKVYESAPDCSKLTP